ncbi:nucleotidyltransferase family protein [Cohnella thermotolerans]|uniref:nucleotidyltransferase domain-containing protein n=1 Tax=Cohnella thermotolerans TaxID=329858 RepID=UPI0004255F5A|nr:nucleotidyltransferase family protein [Cohnella thermotolerans]
MDDALERTVRSLPRELKALLPCLRMQQGKPAWRELPDWEAIDREQLLRLVKHHRVYPLVMESWRSEGDSSAVLQELRALRNRNSLHMLQLAAEMTEVVRLLAERGVPALVLKGPVLAKKLYGDLSLRTSKDLDLLVPPGRIGEAESVLQSRGYREDGAIPRVLNDWMRKTHHASYKLPATGIQIELHWRMNPDTANEPDFEALWARRQEADFSGRTVAMLGPEDLFVYLVSHGARHGWFRLRWLADIDRMLRSPLRWTLLRTLLEQNECRHLAGQAAILCEALLQTPVPEAMRPYMAKRRALRLAKGAVKIIRDLVQMTPKPNSKDVNKYYRRYVFSIRSLRQKRAYLISKLYPSSWDARLLPLPAPLRFLYFPLRPFLWFWRRMRNEASWKTEDLR